MIPRVNIIKNNTNKNYFYGKTTFHVSSEKGIAAAVTGIIVAVLRLLQNFKSVAQLEKFDYTILAVLCKENKRGLNEEELACGLSAFYKDLAVDSIRTRLANLTEYPTINGSKTSLVWKDSEARWHTNNI